jgi:hypothetical protein
MSSSCCSYDTRFVFSNTWRLLVPHATKSAAEMFDRFLGRRAARERREQTRDAGRAPPALDVADHRVRDEVSLRDQRRVGTVRNEIVQQRERGQAFRVVHVERIALERDALHALREAFLEPSRGHVLRRLRDHRVRELGREDGHDLRREHAHAREGNRDLTVIETRDVIASRVHVPEGLHACRRCNAASAMRAMLSAPTVPVSSE